MRRLLIPLLIFTWSFSYGQRHAVGTFFSHLPYQQSFEIAIADSIVYCHAGPSVFSYDIAQGQIERLNKITGLSDMGIRSIGGDPSSKLLFIGYENGNLDLLEGSEIINYRDIRRANIVADRSINHFYFTENLVYISTGFGIAVFDSQRKEFVETYLIGEDESYVFVNATYIFNDTLYASCQDGLYSAALSDELVDFRVWKKEPGLKARNYNHLFSFNDSLFVNATSQSFRSDSVFYKNNGAWYYYDRLSNESNYHIRSNENFLSLAQSSSCAVFNNNWEQQRIVFDYNTNVPPSPRDAYFQEDGSLWIADFNQGLIQSTGDFNNEVLTPEGPKTSNNFSILSTNNKVFVTAGSVSNSWLNNFSPAEVYMLDDNEWFSFDQFSFDTLARMNDILEVESFDGDQFFFGSYGNGLIKCDKNRILNHYTTSNSSLLSIPEDTNYVAISGLHMDDQQNLWVANGRSSSPLHVLSSGGKWISFPINGFSSLDFTGDLIKTSWGHIWLFLPQKGILVYDYNNTLEDFSDDNYRILNSSPNNGNLPSNALQCIAEDESGSVWVGTNLGLRVFFNAASVIDQSSIEADEVLIQQNNITEVLFENDDITALHVDRANRKWVGTKNSGVFLLSADGKEQIANFNEDNSPLFSNAINAISVLETTGEVFIGTEKGIIAYKSDATAPSQDFEQLYVYPNPVPQGYRGLVSVKNTTNNAFVKITDVSGNLIYETRSNGGQATWNGLDRNGEKVATGVYLVFCHDAQGNMRGKTKFLYLR